MSEGKQFLQPRDNAWLVGHEAIEEQVLERLAAGRLPHALLLTGPRGIGKATFAYRFARRLLSGQAQAGTLAVEQAHPVFRRVAIGTHADLLVAEPDMDEKKEERKQDIGVDAVREVGNFLSLTPGESSWRVVIVDSADALNVNAANALLKVLEEPPPQTILLLIAHNPGMVLPTIRSRCHTLRFAPLSADNFARVWSLLGVESAKEQIEAYAQLAGNAPGVAVALHEADALSLYSALVELLKNLPDVNPARAAAFVERVSNPKQLHTRWQVFSQLALILLARAQSPLACIPIVPDEAVVLQWLHTAFPQEALTEQWFSTQELFSLTSRFHLEYRSVVFSWLQALAAKRLCRIAA